MEAEFAFQQWIKKRSRQWKAKRGHEVAGVAKEQLRDIFDLLDADQSGELDVEELEDVFKPVP